MRLFTSMGYIKVCIHGGHGIVHIHGEHGIVHIHGEHGIVHICEYFLFIHPRPPLPFLRLPVASTCCGRLWAKPGWSGKRGVSFVWLFSPSTKIPFFPLFPSVIWAL